MHRHLRPASGLALFLILLLAAGCASTGPAADDETAEADTTAADTAAIAPDEVPESVLARPARQLSPAYGVDLDTVRAGRFDQGKMWTFDHPPVEYFAETYDFRPDEAWFERARLGTLRIPGCTASFVSPTGLVLTNHHCGRSHATSVSREGENILDNGFYAESLGDERPVEGMWADQLVEIREVTAQIEAAVADAQTDAERAQARQDAVRAAEQEITSELGGDYHVEVISLYNGAVYSAYVFRRYTDVRLAMIPELAIGFFGGDPDNFTYPRYTLDMAFFRVYVDGQPVETDHYFPVSTEGVEAGDAVFVIGNPGSTFRLSTVAELQFRRDVEEPAVLDLINKRLEALQASLDDVAEAEQDAVRNQIFSIQNAQKLYQGRVRALNDPVIMARRRDAQEQFLEAIRSDPQLRDEYGGLVEQMRDLQQQKREYADEFWSFLALAPQSSLGAAALRRAVMVHGYLRQGGQGAASGEMLAGVVEELGAVADQPASMQERFLTQRFQTFVDRFGEQSSLVTRVLGGRTPEEAAEYVVENSQLVDAERAAEALYEGEVTMDDPAVQVVDAFASRLADYRSAMAGLSAQEQELSARLGRARYAIYGTDVPPDATFSLRIADGVVNGYPYNGTVAPPYTTFYGLYDHYYSYGAGTAWDLPERWLAPPENFDLKTPLNFVSTNDIIGGNSGSPVIDTDLQLVGLIFDGNIESLSADFIYMTDRVRSVSVDARGILEALADMYDADRLVLEAAEGRMVETETEADAIRSE